MAAQKPLLCCVLRARTVSLAKRCPSYPPSAVIKFVGFQNPIEGSTSTTQETSPLVGGRNRSSGKNRRSGSSKGTCCIICWSLKVTDFPGSNLSGGTARGIRGPFASRIEYQAVPKGAGARLTDPHI